MSQLRLPVRDMVSYSMLAVPLAFASMPLYIHAPDYYATEYGVSLSVLALLLLALRFVDALQDPFIGYMSDLYRKWRVYILVGAAFVLVASFTALFQPNPRYGLAIWFTVFILLSTTAYSVISINLNTVGGMWSRDKSQKTRIAGWREAFGLVGLLLAVVLPSILQQSMPASKAFLWVSAILCLLMIIALMFFIRWYVSIDSWKDTGKHTGGLSLRVISTDSRYLYLVYVLSMLASSIPAVLVLFFIRDRLDAESYAGLFLALYFLSGAFGMPLWAFISRRTSKPTAWLMGMGLAIFSFIWAIFLTPETAWNYGVICVLSGIALGADLALPPSILADQIHDNKREGHASYYFGLLTFLAKFSLAIGTVISLPLLDFYGFKAGETNSETSLLVLSITYAGIPSVIKLFAAFTLWRCASEIQNGAYHVQDTHNAADGKHSYSGSNHHV